MSQILVDTSVWIDYFSSKTRMSKDDLDRLSHHIREDEVVMVEPIRVELLSGQIRTTRSSDLIRLFDALVRIDLDWNVRANWEHLIELAHVARSKKLSIPGVVDRMIVASAESAGAFLYTSDHALKDLAQAVGVQIFR